MSILQNMSLKPYNTFGIDAEAAYFSHINDICALQAILSDDSWHKVPKLILGEGSNILFTNHFSGLVLLNQIKGIEVVEEDNQHIFLKVGAGVNWHDFVMYCVNNNYAGIENLSLIPGTVGAAPVQNIGAYGVELKDTLHCVHTLSIDSKTESVLYNKDCAFGYRDSIFKNTLKNKCVITHVTFRLNKQPTFHITYGAIQQTLKQMNIGDLTIKAVSDAVIHIRQAKLPNPKIIGNAGSFFQNPIIKTITFHHLQKHYPNIPFYIISENEIKISAAWLIEQIGFKGKQLGNAGVYDKQPLVLINYGNASGKEVYDLSEKIKASVLDKFNIILNTEVNIL